MKITTEMYMNIQTSQVLLITITLITNFIDVNVCRKAVLEVNLVMAPSLFCV